MHYAPILAVLLCASCASAFDLNTRASIVSGVPSKIAIGSNPTIMVPFSPNAVSLAVEVFGRTVAAAATYDSGKVCFFGHSDYITKEKTDNFGLVTNCVGWMKTGKSSLVCSLNGLDTPTQRDAVKAAGCTSTTSGGLTQSALSGVDVLFLRSEDLDDGVHTLQNIEAEAQSAFSAACPYDQWGVPSVANPVRTTDLQKRNCMSFARLLPDEIRAVDWAAQSAVFPGDVPNAPRVTRTVTVPQDRTRWYSTGLFVSAASDLTVRIPADQVGKLSLQIGCHTDMLPDNVDWTRWRDITMNVRLSAVETTVKVRFAGLLYIEVSAKGSPIDVQFSGKLSDAPVYRAGTTTADQWNAAVSSTASPWGELEAKDVVFSLPTASLKKVKDMASVGDYWQRVMDCVYHFRTIDPVDWKQRYVTDLQIEAGYMHSGYPIMMWLEVADPTLMTTGTWSHWGQYHEVGHNMQSPMWTFDGTVEVTNNMWSLYCERKMTGNWNWQIGSLANALVKSPAYQKNPDFNVWKNDPWMALLFYIGIGERWGWDTFMDLFREYDALPQNQRPVSDDDKRDQWLVRASKRVNHNLCQLFDMWGIPISSTARQQVASLPAYSTTESSMVQGHVSLKSFFNTFASAQDDGSVQVDRSTVQAWESFDIIPSADKPGAVLIRSAHGKYLSANPGTHSVACNIDKAGDWETFFPMPRGGNQWRFRTSDGTFLETLDNPRVLASYNSEPQGWETFTVDFLPSELLGRVSLKSYFNTYASAQQDGTVQVDRASVQDWEVFTVEASPSNPSAVVFKSAHGKYLSANPDTHKVTCDRDSASDWETFFPESKGNNQWVFRATSGKYLETIDSPRSLAAYNTVPQGWETFTVQHM
eukprot:m51a1_g2817 hypothetical protein (868) ;mRNA; f:163505-166711